MKRLILFLIILQLFYRQGMTQNIWEPTNGPNGVTVIDFVITEDSILVISTTDGIYLSMDHGDTWNKYGKGLPYPYSTAMSLAVGPMGLIFALIGEDLFKLNIPEGKWQSLNHKFSYRSQLVDTKSKNVIVLDADKGAVYFSVDTGHAFIIAHQNNDIKYFGTFSYNGNGNNYFLVNFRSSVNLYKIRDDGSGVILIYSAPDSEFITWHPSGYIYLKTTFELIRMDENGNNITLLKYTGQDSGNYLFKLIVARNGSLRAITERGDLESKDHGVNWDMLNSRISNEGYKIKKVYTLESMMYVYLDNCNWNQVLQSKDYGLTWFSKDSSFTFPRIYQIFKDKLNNWLAKVCGWTEYLISRDGMKSWQRINSPDKYGFYFDFVSTQAGKLFARMSDNKIYESSDYGKSWNQLEILSDSNFYKLAGDNGDMVYAFGYNECYYSKDGGDNWVLISCLPNVSKMDFYFHPDSIIFAVPDRVSNGGWIYQSKNNGLSWSPAIELETLSSFYITNTGIIYLIGNQRFKEHGIFVSFNNLSDLNFLHSITMPMENLIADTIGNLYAIPLYGTCARSTDRGKTWDSFSSGLPEGGVANSFVLDAEQYLYAGFFSDQIYKTAGPVTEFVSTEDVYTISSITIHPNPVESQMNITISNKNISSGHYKIIDLNGTEKLKGEFHAHNFTVDCSSLSNGMAFVQIYGKDKLFVTKKFVIAH